jgi:hypothetical protein
MSNKRTTTKEVFVELVNLQLKPHGKTYNDVSGDPEWYMKYHTSRKDEVKFQKAGIEILRKKLNMTQKLAEQEMSWFILQWGLTTTVAHTELKTEVNKVLKSGTGD